MSNNKQSSFNIIVNWFKLKCPECKSKLTQDFIHHFWGGGETNGYTCTKCKKQWI